MALTQPDVDAKAWTAWHLPTGATAWHPVCQGDSSDGCLALALELVEGGNGARPAHRPRAAGDPDRDAEGSDMTAKPYRGGGLPSPKKGESEREGPVFTVSFIPRSRGRNRHKMLT
jgi:hypothetical protein